MNEQQNLCPFCKEPVNNEDVFCCNCGKEMSKADTTSTIAPEKPVTGEPSVKAFADLTDPEKQAETLDSAPSPVQPSPVAVPVAEEAKTEPIYEAVTIPPAPVITPPAPGVNQMQGMGATQVAGSVPPSYSGVAPSASPNGAPPSPVGQPQPVQGTMPQAQQQRPGFNQPGQPPQYGVPNQAPMQQGGGYNNRVPSYNTTQSGVPMNQPGYGGPPQGGGYPPQNMGYPGGPMLQPVKTKSKAPLIVTLVVLGLFLISGIAFFLLWQSGVKAKNEAYQTLLTSITSSSSTSRVVSYSAELDTFADENPDLVDNDLKTLVEVSEDYEDATDEEARYTNMLLELEKLEYSTVTQVADCASVLVGYVEDEYALYQEQIALSELTLPDTEEFSEFALPLEVDGDGLGIVSEIDGEACFSMSAVNTTDQEIVYFEIFAFCYDENGNEIIGENGQSWEWNYDGSDGSLSLPSGGRHTPKGNGYWAFYNCENVAYVVPVVSYVEYADGSTWGITNGTMEVTPEIIELAEVAKGLADLIISTAV